MIFTNTYKITQLNSNNFVTSSDLKAGVAIITFDATGVAVLNHNCDFNNNYVLFAIGRSEMFNCVACNPISGNTASIIGRVWNDATQPVTGSRAIQWMAFTYK